MQFVRPPVVKHVCSEQVYCPGPPVHCCVTDAFVGGAAGEVAEGAGPGLGGKITSGLVGIGPGGFDTPGCTAVTGGNGAGVGVAPGITAGLVWGGSCGGVLSMMTIPGEWAGGRPTTTGDRGCADVSVGASSSPCRLRREQSAWDRTGQGWSNISRQGRGIAWRSRSWLRGWPPSCIRSCRRIPCTRRPAPPAGSESTAD